MRRVSITNSGARAREIEVTSYAELVLAPPRPTTRIRRSRTSSFRPNPCRARHAARDAPAALAGATPLWLAHVMAVEGETVGDLQYETDRARFLGRGRGVRTRDRRDGRRRSVRTRAGAVLDPIFSLRRRVRIRPGRTVHVAFSTLVAATREEVLDLADKYHDVTTFERAATLAWTQAQVQLHHLGIDADEAHLFQTLARPILYSDRALRAPADVLTRRSRRRRGALGARHLGRPADRARADRRGRRRRHRAPAAAGARVLAHEAARGRSRHPERARAVVRAGSADAARDARAHEQVHAAARRAPRAGRIFMLRADQMSAPQHATCSRAWRASSSRAGAARWRSRSARATAPSSAPVTLRALAPAPGRRSPRCRRAPPPRRRISSSSTAWADSLPDGREYVTALRPGAMDAGAVDQRDRQPALRLPRVGIAAPGCTWSGNSQENQLTRVVQRPGERSAERDVLHARRRHGRTVDADPAADPRGRTASTSCGTATATAASSTTRTASRSSCCSSCRSDDPIKISRLTLTNHSARARRLSVTAYRRVGAGHVAQRLRAVRHHRDRRGHAARCSRATRGTPTSAARVAFADLGGAQTSWTGDRTEFLGRNGALGDRSRSLRGDRALGPHRRGVRSRAPRCRPRSRFAAGGTATCSFLLGQAENARAGARADHSATARPISTPALARSPTHGTSVLGTRAGEDARSRARSHAQPLAAVSDARVPALGAHRRSTSRAARTDSATSCRT